MPLITVRISEEDKRRLAKHGTISDAIREAVQMYLNSEDSVEVFEKLGGVQARDRVRTTPDEMLRLIKEDRYRDSGR